MPDLLPPRLLARVERSLRKRIHTDIHPHLLRVAAHARTSDEFLAAAARLLLNPQERQQWLATWTKRQQRETAEASVGPDSAPSELIDTTSPASLDVPVQRSVGITPDELQGIRNALAKELGAEAQQLVDTELLRSESAAELLARLQNYLIDDFQRARFVNSSLSKAAPDS